MQLPALIFPRTALLRSTLLALAPLFEPVCVMEPPSLERPAQASPLEQAGLTRVLRPSAGLGAQAAGPEARRLAGQLRQWQEWARLHQGSSQAEALKAGLPLPPGPEGMHDIMGQIRSFGQGPAGAAQPEVQADLLLHLIHLQDQQGSEMEDLLARVEAGQQRLGSIMGLEEEDYQPADYDQAFSDRLSPLDYGQDQERQLARRLQAWATLAGRLEDPGAWLATDNLAAAHMLMERVNRRLLPPGEELRSPAGAAVPLAKAPASDPNPPLAQEAFRLVLPDLAGLEDQALLELRARLEQSGALDKARQGLAGLLERLSLEPWSPALGEGLAGAARALAQELAVQCAQTGLAGQGGQALSVLALPGLSREQVLGLMAGGRDQGLPGLAQGPGQSTAGSYPLIVIW